MKHQIQWRSNKKARNHILKTPQPFPKVQKSLLGCFWWATDAAAAAAGAAADEAAASAASVASAASDAAAAVAVVKTEVAY